MGQRMIFCLDCMLGWIVWIACLDGQGNKRGYSGGSADGVYHLDQFHSNTQKLFRIIYLGLAFFIKVIRCVWRQKHSGNCFKFEPKWQKSSLSAMLFKTRGKSGCYCNMKLCGKAIGTSFEISVWEGCMGY